MISLKIHSIKGVELKTPTTIYGWCSYQNTDETNVMVSVCWNWTKEEARANKHAKHDALLVEEVTKLLNGGESKKAEGKQMISSTIFAVHIEKIKGQGFEACKKSIEAEVQKGIEEAIKPKQ